MGSHCVYLSLICSGFLNSSLSSVLFFVLFCFFKEGLGRFSFFLGLTVGKDSPTEANDY